MPKKLNPFVDSIDDIPEDETIPVRDLYVPGKGAFDGRFVLNVGESDGVELRDTRALKKALEDERKARRDADAALKSFTDPDSGETLDPDEIRDALAKVRAGNIDGDAEKIREEVEKQIRAEYDRRMDAQKGKFEKEIEQLNGKFGNARSKLDQTLRISRLEEAFRKKGAGKHARALAKVAAASVRMTDDFDTEILDENGEVRFSEGSGGTQKMGLEEFVESDYVGADEYQPFFGSGNDASGGGSGGGEGGGPNGVPRLSAQEALDPDKYRAAKAAAEKAGLSAPVIYE